MKRLFGIIAVISVIAAMGMVMTACGNEEESNEETTAAQTTVQPTTAAQGTTASAEKATAQQTTAAQATTAAPKSDDDKKSSETESSAADSSDASEDKSDNDGGETVAGISEEDAKVMALLDLVTEDASVESCKQGKDKNGADCWVIILKDADNDRYISYVNADGSTTLPYSG